MLRKSDRLNIRGVRLLLFAAAAAALMPPLAWAEQVAGTIKTRVREGASAAVPVVYAERLDAPTPDRPDGSWLETSRTADAVRLTAQDAGVRVTEIAAEAGHPLERLADLISRTDFASVYMALAGGIDPLTSPHVADLRDRTR